MITIEELKTYVSYDPESGLFTRLLRPTNGRGYVGEILGRDHNGYIRCSLNKNHIFAHRLALVLHDRPMA